jgi:hypothetical protein
VAELDNKIPPWHPACKTMLASASGSSRMSCYQERERWNMAVSKVLVAFLAALALGVRPAAADLVFFNNLGANDSFSTSASFFGFDFGEEGAPDTTFARAMPFVAGASGTLGKVELPLEFPFSFDQGSLAVNVFAADGDLPGALLETFSNGDDFSVGSGLFAFSSVQHPHLTAGQLYFIEATTVGMADGLWFLTNGDSGGIQRDILRVNNGPWLVGQRDFTAAFRVTGAADTVPEPASLLLVGTGLACAGRRYWRTTRSAGL